MMLGARIGMWGGAATPTAADYVQDGLVAMWDALENGGKGVHADSGLVEWVGKYAFPNVATSEVGDDYVKLITTSFDASVTPDYKAIPYTQDEAADCCEQVIEYPVAITTVSNAIYISAQRSYTTQGVGSTAYKMTRYIGAYANKSKGVIYGFRGALSAASTYAVPYGERHQYHGSVSMQLAGGTQAAYYLDNSSTPFLTWTGGSTVSSIDGREAVTGLRGSYEIPEAEKLKLSCIRWYNRILTADERAANYAIDKARYNLT